MRRALLAFLGTDADAGLLDAVARRFGLRLVTADQGLRLFAGNAIADRVMPDGSTLLGDIFSRSGATCHSPSDGWGSFLAFFRVDAGWRIDRAPLTGLPLYWTRWRGGILCASHLETIGELIDPIAVDWDFAAKTLIYSNLRT